MNTVEKRLKRERSKIYKSSEEEANKFNLFLIAILFVVAIVAEILCELGIFNIPKMTMRVSLLFACIVFLIPICIWLVRDYILKKERSTFSEPWFWAVIVTSIFISITEVCIVYSQHTIMLIAVPPLVIAQYYKNKSTFWWGVIGTVLLVPVSVYGGFLFGVTDRNLIKVAIDAEELTSISSRLALATPQRLLEILLHYVFPRWMCALGVLLLAGGITRHHKKMLERQEELTKKISDSMERKNMLQAYVIDSLAALIETRDEETGEHVIRTKKYVSMIAEALKKDEKFKDVMKSDVIERIEAAAPLHDIGKIAISDTILLKPGKLTPEEFEKMKTHTVKGERMVSKLFAKMDDPMFLKTAEDIIIAHHERWDGSGYPYGKKGDEIPLSARIMAVADVFDALVSYRVYKPSVSPEAALDTIYSESGTHFDPDIIRVLKSISADFIREANSPIASEV